MRRTRLLACLLGTLAALVLFGGVGGTASPAHANRSLVTVPRLVGLPVEEAFQRLSDAGLRVETSEPVRLGPTRGLPSVFQQKPRPGSRVKAGTVVSLRFCGLGGGLVMPTFEEVAAPDVAGLPLHEALARLADSPVVWTAMLPPLPATSANSFLDAYRVTGQEPEAGTRFVQTTRRSSKRVTEFQWTKLELYVTG